MLTRKCFLLIMVLLFLSSPSFARVVCPFKPPHPEISENCSDLDFTQTLRASNLPLIKDLIHQNPNYIFACNLDPLDDFDLFSTLTFAICKHGDQKDLPEIVRLFIANGADPRCESLNLHITPLICAKNLTDPRVRYQVIKLLQRRSAHLTPPST